MIPVTSAIMQTAGCKTRIAQHGTQLTRKSVLRTPDGGQAFEPKEDCRMNEVKSPKKPLIYYYGIVLLVLMLFNFLALP